MKTILNLKKSIFFVTALFTVISFASCSDDDDPAPSVTDVYGSYKGKMSVNAALYRSTGREASSSMDVTAIVKSDTIYFENFPVKSIIAAIEGKNDVDDILESMDKVNFKVGYEGELNQAKDSIGLVLDPKPMAFSYKVTEGEDEIEKKVEVTVSIPESSKSAYSAKILKFYLVAEELMLNDEAVDTFGPLYYNFELNKQ